MAGVAIKATVDNKAMLRALNMIEKDLAPKVMAETLNRTADAVTKQMQRNIKSDFTLRTKFTMKSTENSRAKPWRALNKAMGKIIDRMFSRSGTFSPYLWKQENTGKIKSESGGAYPIATVNARTSRSYKKSVAKRNRLPSGSLTDGDYGPDTFIGTPAGRERGMYQRKRGSLILLRRLNQNSIDIKGTHFHGNAVKKYGTPQFIEAMFNKIANKALSKRGLSG